MFKVIIASSREFNDYSLLKAKCSKILSTINDEITVVSGCARGADKLGERYAEECGYAVERFPANWEKDGKAAGYRRNEVMAENANALIAFWDGESKGTKHMIETAKKKGLSVRVIKTEAAQKTEKENEDMNTEIKFEDVKAMAFYFLETLSNLAKGLTPFEYTARKVKGLPLTLMQAIDEVITPDDVIGKNVKGEDVIVGHKPNKYNGYHKVYSQRCFDEGVIGDPYEYTGVQFGFKLQNGISITIDTKFGNIRAQYYTMKYDVGMGQNLCKKLDDLGFALWRDWDDSPEGLISKMREIEDETRWWDDDYLYTEAVTSPDPANVPEPVEYESQFTRDVRGGVKYTDREWDGHSGLYLRYESKATYDRILAEQKAKIAECRKKDMLKAKYKITAPGKMIKWETMTEEQREKAMAAYKMKKAVSV